MKALRRFRYQETGKIWSRQQAAEAGLKLVTTDEYAKTRNYAPRTVRKYAQCGKLNAFKQGKKWFIAVPTDE